MALDLATKASIRRHLGLPASGSPYAGETLGLRTVTRAGQLELYMNVLQIEEEAIILGQPYGSILIYDPVYATDTLTVSVITGVAPNQVTTTYAYTVLTTDTSLSIAQKIVAYLSPRIPGIQISAGQQIVGNVITPGQSQISMKSMIGTFILAGSAANGGNPAATNVTVLAAGNVYPSPKYTVDDGGGIAANATVAYGLLPVCDALEAQLLAASQNLSFSTVGSTSIGGASFRSDELVVRNSLLARYRRELGVMLSFVAPDDVMGIGSFGIEV